MKPKKPRKSKSKSIAGHPTGELVRLVSYEITYEPLKDERNPIPKPVEDRLQELYNLAHEHPRQAIEQLLELKEKYPKVPVLYNFLSAAYGRAGDKQAGNAVAEENYRNNPDYLFAKINYAQLCLLNGKHEQIPAIFDNKFDLSLLYPHRKIFHVTEFLGFSGVMCAYYSVTGKRETAKILYKAMVDIEPESPMVAFAGRFLFTPLIDGLQNLMLRPSSGKAKAKAEITPPNENTGSGDSDFKA